MECSLACQQSEQRHQVERDQVQARQQIEERPSKVTWRQRLYRWRQLSRERYALRHLSDDMLKDIGISREAVQRESHRPFWDDRGWRR